MYCHAGGWVVFGSVFTVIRCFGIWADCVYCILDLIGCMKFVDGFDCCFCCILDLIDSQCLSCILDLIDSQCLSCIWI